MSWCFMMESWGSEYYESFRRRIVSVETAFSPLLFESVKVAANSRRKIREAWQCLNKTDHESDIEKLWENRDLIGVEEYA